jgi:hypothetical protein
MSNNSKLFRLTVFVMLAILAGILLTVGAFSANAESDCPNMVNCYPTKTPTVTVTPTSSLPTPGPTESATITPQPINLYYAPVIFNDTPCYIVWFCAIGFCREVCLP